MSLNDIWTIKATLENLQDASAFYALNAFVNMDEYPCFNKFQMQRSEFFRLFKNIDFIANGKLLPDDIKIYWDRYAHAESIQELIDIWNSLTIIEDGDLHASIMEKVAFPIEEQMCIILQCLK